MSRFWHFKDITSSFISNKQPVKNIDNELYLPNQIGCRIIQMEMQTLENQNLTKQVIMDLLTQYNKAIQFYEERGSQKYLLYQKKLQAFIMRPSVTEVLQGKTGNFLLKKQKKQQQLKKLQMHSHAQVKKMIQNSQNSGKKQKQIIQNHLNNQQKDLQNRIQRKRAMSSQNKRPKVTTASFSMPSSQKQIAKELLICQNFTSQFISKKNVNVSQNSKKLAF